MQLAMVSRALLFASLVTPALGATLRHREANVANVSLRQDSDPQTPEAIQEKWDKMDEFLEVMFTMACNWQHGKDIHGLAAEKLKKGEISGADGYHAYVKELQEKNVKGLQTSCGLIVAEQKKKCRQGCATRWNAAIEKRNECDGKCVEVYASFEKSCMAKAENLEKVYEQKTTKAKAQQQCYEGHCSEFPMVWMKTDESAMKAEVDKQCASRCTDDNVKAGCQKKWLLEADYHASSVGSQCAEDSGVKVCFDDKKGKASSNYDTCKSTTKKTCDDAYTECKSKGNVDNADKNAKAFCDDRKKLCEEQASEKCLSENKADLEKAKTECEAVAGDELKTCKETKLQKIKEDKEKECIAERGPTCKTDCEGKCQVEKMNKCLDLTKSDHDPAKFFCKEFWHLLHSSSEVDPVTGNPIVLLSRESSALAPAV